MTIISPRIVNNEFVVKRFPIVISEALNHSFVPCDRFICPEKDIIMVFVEIYKNINNPDKPINTLYHLLISSLSFLVYKMEKTKRINPKMAVISKASKRYIISTRTGIKSFSPSFVFDKKYDNNAK